MDETEITAVVCRPGDDARVVPIPNTLDAFVDAVGGLFEVLFLSNPGVWAYVHEEGVLLGLPWNRILRNQPIAGNILVTGITSSGDDDQSLTIVERERVLQLLNGRAARLRPTPSSVEEWEAMTGRPIFWPHRAGEPMDTATTGAGSPSPPPR